MGHNQLKALGKSAMIVIWFYMISLISSGLVSVFSKQPTQFIIRHGNLLNILCYVVIFMGVYLMDKKRNDFFKELKYNGIKEIVRCIAMGLGAYLIGIAITNALIGYFPDYQNINQSFNQYEPFLRFIAIVLLPPLVEEYLFRYRAQGILREGFGSIIAIIGQALLFGMLHFYMLQKIYATVLGVIFGVVKEKRGIRTTIGMHMTVNFIGWFIGCLIN